MRIDVSGAPLPPALRAALAQAAWAVAWTVFFVGLLVAATATLVWLRARGRRTRDHATPSQSLVRKRLRSVPDDADARWRELVRDLEREPTRARATAVRDELRARAGARMDETLADLARRGALHGAAGAALTAVERASFCEEEHVAEAVHEALPYLC